MSNLFTWLSRNFFFLFITFLVIALFFVNRYIYQHRFEGYMYKEAVNYAQFYCTQSDYRVSGLQKVEPDTLVVKIEPSFHETVWHVLTPADSYSLNSVYPHIKLHPGIQSYKVYAELPFFRDTINFRLELSGGDVAFTYCSLPTIRYEIFPVEKWTTLPARISNEEKELVSAVLKNEIGISDSMTSTKKIKLIGQFLLHKMRKNEGYPSDSIKSLTPFRQYQLVCEKNDTVDCAVWTDIFFLFANSAGVPTRKIEVTGTMDYIGISGHVFNECYIREQQCWAFVDLTSRKLMVQDKKGRVFNTVELLQVNRRGMNCDMETVTINGSDSIIEKEYASTNQSELDYLKETILLYTIRPDINNNMSFSESFEEFLGEIDHYGVAYADSIIIDNSKHYLKLFIYKTSLGLFYFWLFLVLIKIIRLFFRRAGKKT